jgi:hypothetical protein
MKMKITTSLIILLFFFPGIMLSQEVTDPETNETPTADWSFASQWGVGVKAGLNGIGFEIVKGFGDRLNLRLAYSTFSYPYSTEQTIEGIDLLAEAKATLGAIGAIIDFYPVKNFIHLSAGVIQNNTLVSVSINPLSGFPYGDLTVPPEDLGGVSADLGPELSVAPYLALGFGNTLSRKHRVSFNFELGAIYQGAPQLYLDGSGMLAPMASDHNAQVIMDAIAPYKWFPVLNFQLTFKIL